MSSITPTILNGDRTLDATVSSIMPFLKGAQPRPPRRKTFDAPMSGIFPQGRNSVGCRTASDVLPSGVLCQRCFRSIGAPWGAARSIHRRICCMIDGLRLAEPGPVSMRPCRSHWAGSALQSAEVKTVDAAVSKVFEARCARSSGRHSRREVARPCRGLDRRMRPGRRCAMGPQRATSQEVMLSPGAAAQGSSRRYAAVRQSAWLRKSSCRNAVCGALAVDGGAFVTVW